MMSWLGLEVVVVDKMIAVVVGVGQQDVVGGDWVELYRNELVSMAGELNRCWVLISSSGVHGYRIIIGTNYYLVLHI